MSAPYFVEILARNGDVQHRHRVASLPIRLGRAYDNDCILDDAHTAPHHAIVEDGEHGLLLSDLGSKNGCINQGKRQDRITLSGNTVVRIGHTRLRIRAADFAVEPELADTTMHGWEGITPGLIGLFLIALLMGLEQWQGDVEAFQPIRYLLAIASGIGAAMLWAGIWALANRLFGGHARLGRHLFILGSGLLVLSIWSTLSKIAAFAWSAEWLTRYGSLVSIALFCGVLFFHLRTVKPQHPKRFLITCMVLMVGGSSLALMSNLQGSGRTADELYMSVLLPPSLRDSPNRDIDQFMARTATLRNRADAARASTVKDAVDDSDEDDSD